jgi:hypothetical protein
VIGKSQAFSREGESKGEGESNGFQREGETSKEKKKNPAWAK